MKTMLLKVFGITIVFFFSGCMNLFSEKIIQFNGEKKVGSKIIQYYTLKGFIKSEKKAIIKNNKESNNQNTFQNITKMYSDGTIYQSNDYGKSWLKVISTFNSKELQIYPNPSKIGFINISNSNIKEKITEFQIVSFDGEIINIRINEFFPNLINTTNFKRGVYLIFGKGNDGCNYSSKFYLE